MTRWEIVREWNKVVTGWEAQTNLGEEGVSLEDAQALSERFYALTIEERLKEAGLASGGPMTESSTSNNNSSDVAIREGCCADRPKPCTYHEGWADGTAALEDQLENMTIERDKLKEHLKFVATPAYELVLKAAAESTIIVERDQLRRALTQACEDGIAWRLGRYFKDAKGKN